MPREEGTGMDVLLTDCNVLLPPDESWREFAERCLMHDPPPDWHPNAE